MNPQFPLFPLPTPAEENPLAQHIRHLVTQETESISHIVWPLLHVLRNTIPWPDKRATLTHEDFPAGIPPGHRVSWRQFNRDSYVINFSTDEETFTPKQYFECILFDRDSAYFKAKNAHTLGQSTNGAIFSGHYSLTGQKDPSRRSISPEQKQIEELGLCVLLVSTLRFLCHTDVLPQLGIADADQLLIKELYAQMERTMKPFFVAAQ